MAIGNETFNHELYSLLKVRGYKPSPLNSQNQRVKASQEADVIEFDFIKDGENYGKVWASIDDASNVCIYFDDEQAESPSNNTPGTDYDDTWTGLLKHIKQWAQRRQLSFELANKDRLGDDMRQRDYYKMKEKLGEGYHPMGKKASYNDAVPNVKIILQHNRGLEEGEQRYRNVAKIFLENQDGERFLAPTTRPGIARVYARHIAEGGVPNDERWNHIKSICEEYNKMAGFVRATRNKEFNESALSLVQEGANHYGNLRETLNKLAGHRGYHAYFESYTPPLMEDEDDTNINELFVQETMDPRIESVMPILSRLHKKVSETAVPEVDSLAEWADSVINEKLDMDDKKKDKKKEQEKDSDSEKKSIGHGPGPLDRIKGEAEKKMSGKIAKSLGIQEGDVNEMEKDLHSGTRHDPRKGPQGPDKTAKMMAAKDAVKAARKSLDKAFKGDVEENFIGMAPQAVAEEEVEESGLQAYLGKKKYGEKGMKALQQAGRDGASKEKMATIRAKHDKLDEEEMDEGIRDNLKKAGMAAAIGASVFGASPLAKDSSPDAEANYHHRPAVSAAQDSERDAIAPGDSNWSAALRAAHDSLLFDSEEEVEEGLDANQKRVGQLGPTEKVKNNNIGKLVGANESVEIPEELARIIEMARFKR